MPEEDGTAPEDHLGAQICLLRGDSHGQDKHDRARWPAGQ
jgi:hypothetical protein